MLLEYFVVRTAQRTLSGGSHQVVDLFLFRGAPRDVVVQRGESAFRQGRGFEKQELAQLIGKLEVVAHSLFDESAELCVEYSVFVRVVPRLFVQVADHFSS